MNNFRWFKLNKDSPFPSNEKIAELSILSNKTIENVFKNQHL